MDDPPLWLETLGWALAYGAYTVARWALVASALKRRREGAGTAIGPALSASVLNGLYFIELFLVVATAGAASRAVGAEWPQAPSILVGLATVALMVVIRALARAVLPYSAAAILGYFAGPVAKLASVMLWPVFAVARFAGGALGRLTRAGVDAAAISPAAELLQADQAAAPPLAEEERNMIDAIFDFRDTVAREVMIPRVDIVAADVTDSLADIKRAVVEKGVSRVPVVEGTPDNVIGILHAKDIFKLEETRADIRTVLRQPLFVPETKKVNELLREFKGAKTQLAIVVDEYGGTSGLVTLEDVIEEIVGEIQDEYDAEVTLLEPKGPGEWLVAGRMDIGELNEELGTAIPEEDFETLGGFVSSLFGKVPAPGEVTTWGGYRFEVTSSDARRVNQVRITATEGKDSSRED